MVDTDEQQGNPPAPPNADQEWLQTYMGEHQGEIGPGTRVQGKGRSEFTLLLVAIVVLAVAGAALFLTKSKGLQIQANAKAIDLGQGVSTDNGLRGHLVAEWKDKAVHYKLKIEPIDNLAVNGFAHSVVGIKQPVYLNVRVLDATGQALCGKQMMLTAGTPLTAGADAFKVVNDSYGVPAGLWAEGTLPCSSEQYSHFDYWDFTTTFPTVADQDKMLGIPLPQTEEDRAAAAQAAAQPQPQSTTAGGEQSRANRTTARRKAVAKKPQSAFYLEGDDHVTAFERGRNVLTVGPGKSFTVVRPGDLATAAAWADDAALVHYTCDQRASCTLRHSGTLIPARMNN